MRREWILLVDDDPEDVEIFSLALENKSVSLEGNVGLIKAVEHFWKAEFLREKAKCAAD